MAPDESTQSTESPTVHRAELGQSRSRRGFLKQAAATGVAGVMGITGAATLASAHDGDRHYSNHDKTIYIYAFKHTGVNDYTFRTTGDIDHLGQTDPNDHNENAGCVPTCNVDEIEGRLHEGHADKFAFNGDIVWINTPNLEFYLYNQSGNDELQVTPWANTGWNHYRFRATAQIKHLAKADSSDDDVYVRCGCDDDGVDGYVYGGNTPPHLSNNDDRFAFNGDLVYVNSPNLHFYIDGIEGNG